MRKGFFLQFHMWKDLPLPPRAPCHNTHTSLNHQGTAVVLTYKEHMKPGSIPHYVIISECSRMDVFQPCRSVHFTTCGFKGAKCILIGSYTHLARILIQNKHSIW